MTNEQLKRIFEGAIMASGQPMSIERLIELFDEEQQPSKETVREILMELAQDYANHSIELKELASGFTFQVKAEYSPWISKIWEERPGRYSRALLETLALIAYRQPITRAEIEDIRGVAVSSHIIKTLQEREWVRIVGYRDVPGKPGLYATTRQFLDHFNLKTLDELPPLTAITQLPEGDIATLSGQVQEELSESSIAQESSDAAEATGDIETVEQEIMQEEVIEIPETSSNEAAETIDSYENEDSVPQEDELQPA